MELPLNPVAVMLLQAVWSATVQLVVLITTLVLAVGAVPLLYLSAHWYLGATVFSPLKTPPGGLGTQVSRRAGGQPWICLRVCWQGFVRQQFPLEVPGLLELGLGGCRPILARARLCTCSAVEVSTQVV
jgi:hypothetical protein